MIDKNYTEKFIVPSILSADFSCLKKEIKSVEKYAGWIQVDIMDGHFVPNLSFGPHITSNLRKITKLPIDVHLMVENPLDFIIPFYKSGADLITCHIESKNFLKALKKTKQLNIMAGLAIKPATPIKNVLKYLNHIDLLLIMTVEPGFGGQAFIESMLDKIKEASAIREKKGYKFHIQVDGGINEKTIFDCIKAGANSFVMGNALFSRRNPYFIKMLYNKIKRGFYA